MLRNLYYRIVLAAKRLVYMNRGEPYHVAGRTVRYVPGTRPVRLGYAHSRNRAVRFDALQVKLLSSGLKEGDTAIDIGAHAGQYCLLMAEMCGKSGRVIAFEPDPHARSLLNRNIALNPKLKSPTIETCAVSDAAGEAVLFSCGGNSQSSLARSGIGINAAESAEQFTVLLVTLDDYIASHALSAPRWVKIDVEGAEIRVLKGAAKLLAGDTQIICELHPYAWPEFGDSFETMQELVAASGRSIRYLDEPREFNGVPIYGSVLLERKAE